MSSYNDLLVGSVALVGSAVALAVAVGPWEPPYRLRTIAAIVNRFGMPTARAMWVVIAIVSLIAGIAIVSGIRPGYAKPRQGFIDAASGLR